jgi:AMP phosphorylase
MPLKLKVRCLDLDAGGKAIVILDPDDAHELGVHALDRIILRKGKRSLTAVVNTSEKFVKKGTVVVYDEVTEILKLKPGDVVEAEARPELASKLYIRKKLDGLELSYREIKEIVSDVISRNLSDLELTLLVSALHTRGLTLNENIFFTKAFVETSAESLRFPGTVVDKHSAGGVPGDKTTMVLIPIIAAAGLTIPKTSSRAITDPAGTADRVEMVAPVELSAKKIESVVKSTGGCMAWGGALNMAPADDLLIQIERPLALDPLIVPSVLAKKKIVGSRYVVIDLPTGPEAKMKTLEEAEKLARTFIQVGKKLGMRIECVITRADQPLGRAIGPGLEAREALQALMDPRSAAPDLIDKALSLAGVLLRMVGRGDRETAKQILESGAAERKFREIIKAQGGDAKIRPDDIAVESNSTALDIRALQSGEISYISNRALVNIARLAGAPKDKFAGILLHKKSHDFVRKGESLYTIYAEKPAKLKQAEAFAKSNSGYIIYTPKRRIVMGSIDRG